MNNNSRKNLPTKISLILRMVVAAYILYLSYGLVTSEDPKEWYIWAFAGAFFVFGVIFIFFSLKALLKGEYQEAMESEEVEAEPESSDTDIKEIENAEVIDGTESDARLMGMYADSVIETASDEDIEKLD